MSPTPLASTLGQGPAGGGEGWAEVNVGSRGDNRLGGDGRLRKNGLLIGDLEIYIRMNDFQARRPHLSVSMQDH